MANAEHPGILAASGDRFIGGINWGKDPAPHQEIITLTSEEAQALRSGDRLDRLLQAGGIGVRPLLLDPLPQKPRSRLLITGNEAGVAKVKDTLDALIDKDAGMAVVVHPNDAQALRKPSRALVADVEKLSGCRVIVDDQRKHKPQDPIVQRKTHRIHLLGDTESQRHALNLLQPHCKYLTLPDDPEKPRMLLGFHADAHGPCIQLSERLCVARRVDPEARRTPRGCVVFGDGHMNPYAVGSFFCLGVRQLDTHPRLLGGTRIGVSSRPLGEPVPESILTKPPHSWVLGRGFARGPRGPASKLEMASLDFLEKGDEIGVLVTRSMGSIAIFKKHANSFDWECLVHWDAGVPEPQCCFALFELSGRLAEVELLHRQPPAEVNRPIDPVSVPPPVWPPPKR